MSTTSKYLVPASYEYHGHIEVEANSPEEAIEKAHSLTYGEIKEAIHANGPCSEFFVSDEIEQVEEDSIEEEE